MSLHTEDIKNRSAPEKAKLFSLLQNDREPGKYMISNDILFEELARGDKAYAEGKVHLTHEGRTPYPFEKA